MFIETRLLECVSYGTQGGPTWVTRKAALNSGIVRRNPRRSRPTYRFAVLYKNLRESDHREVINAFNACMGGVDSFRLKDWSDFEVEEEAMDALGTGAEQTQQLYKRYTFGTRTVTRPIRKPVDSTVILTANDVPISADVDYTTGIVTYTAANGAVVRWSGQFDVPVMFSDDELTFSFRDRNVVEGFFLDADVQLEEDLEA
jgi:uncharacterized protein (TIGR02217 family)